MGYELKIGCGSCHKMMKLGRKSVLNKVERNTVKRKRAKSGVNVCACDRERERTKSKSE